MKMNMKRGLSAAMTLVMLACGACPALAEDKKETVFVMADATGETDHIVVSERLYNADGSDVLTDVSALDNIENVGGEQTFSDENGMLVWNAQGSDISYEGTSEAPLPVSVHISYKLDGRDVTPEELAGKSGHLEISIE